jgi:hypothetical protein
MPGQPAARGQRVARDTLSCCPLRHFCNEKKSLLTFFLEKGETKGRRNFGILRLACLWKRALHQGLILSDVLKIEIG